MHMRLQEEWQHIAMSRNYRDGMQWEMDGQLITSTDTSQLGVYSHG